jgi:hypothetical protein
MFMLMFFNRNLNNIFLKKNEQPRRPERGAFWYKQRGIQMDLNNYNDPRVGE